MIIILLYILHSPTYAKGDGVSDQIDTTRFSLNKSEDQFFLVDKQENSKLFLKKDSLINPDEAENEITAYVSSFMFSTKVNSFTIGNGLIGIQLSSFEAMKEGSAQAAAGRDMFLLYDPEKKICLHAYLDFGITKQRHRYMGCLNAITSHFITADIDEDGLTDIGRIKETLKCEERLDENGEMICMSGPFFVQNSVEWYIFKEHHWKFDSSYTNIDKYIDFPLIEIKLSPVDVFGFNRWRSFNPKKWDRKSDILYYPQYRLQLMKMSRTQKLIGQ
jgi:hypothetical protein